MSYPPPQNQHKLLTLNALQIRQPSSKANKLETLLVQARSVCFIGDSVTAGSENGKHPWYEPLTKAFPHLQVKNMSVGGGTSKSLLRICKEKLQVHSLYIIALGTNDVRYRDPARGAMTCDEYVNNLDNIISIARQQSPEAQFVCIAPWCSIPEDPIPPIPQKNKDDLLSEFSLALSKYCNKKGHLFLDPTPTLYFLIKHPALRQHYLQDHIHPTHPYGCYLYSAAVWEAAYL